MMIDFDVLNGLIDTGHPIEALSSLAAHLKSDATDPEVLRLAIRALTAAQADPVLLANWGGDARHGLMRVLLTQRDCATRPLIFAHAVASNISAGNLTVARQLVTEATSTLRVLLDEDKTATPVVFAITARALIDGTIPQDEISRLHLKWFAQFDPEDLALAYNVMFSPDHFGKNRDDLAIQYGGAKTPNLPPTHVLFVEWLLGQSQFATGSGKNLLDYLKSAAPQSEVDLAASRTLLLRYSDEKSLSSETLKALGATHLKALLTDLAQTRATLPERKTDQRSAAKMETRHYRAIQLLRKKIPVLHRRRTPRVAVCVSGQLRGFEAALASWRKTLFVDIEPVFFVHSWRLVGRSDANPSRYILPFAGHQFSEEYRKCAMTEGYQNIRAAYPTLFEALTSGNEAREEDLKSLFGTDHVVLDDEKDARFDAFSNQHKMHYKIFAADQMARAHGPFDLHIRIRPDLSVKMAAFDWRDMLDACRARPVLYTEKPYGLHYGNLMMGDQFAVGTPETMGVYSDTWKSFPRLAEAGLGRCPPSYTGHVSLALTCWLHRLDIVKAAVKFGGFNEARTLTSHEIREALRADATGSLRDQRLLEAVENDLTG